VTTRRVAPADGVTEGLGDDPGDGSSTGSPVETSGTLNIQCTVDRSDASLGGPKRQRGPIQGGNAARAFRAACFPFRTCNTPALAPANRCRITDSSSATRRSVPGEAVVTQRAVTETQGESPRVQSWHESDESVPTISVRLVGYATESEVRIRTVRR
jgi:hypothetical protein